MQIAVLVLEFSYSVLCIRSFVFIERGMYIIKYEAKFVEWKIIVYSSSPNQ